MTYPTAVCAPVWHAREGGCFQCCDGCNYATHRCHFCGDDLRHDGRLPDGEINTCYATCECGHIGHEHFADSCRGGEYTLTGTTETDCDCTGFRLRKEEA
jgi:hypothetical protein